MEAEKKDFNKSFTEILVGDVIAAHDRYEQQDIPPHRRDLVRAVSAAIEGVHWQLKQDVLEHPDADLSMHEHAAMSEESYVVDERGIVHASSRFLPLANAIRLVVRMVRRYRPSYDVDFGHPGWAALKASIEARNRLVHPKTIDDLTVSDDDIAKTMAGLYWVLELVAEVLEQNRDALADYVKDLKRVVGHLKRESAARQP